MNRIGALCTTFVLVAVINAPATAGLVGVDNFTKNLLSIDETTGASTVVSTLNILGGISGMTLDPTAQILYGFDTGNNDVISINALTGDFTVVADLSFEMRALAFDQSTSTLYGVDSVVNQKLYTIDTGSGTATAGPMIDTMNAGIQGLTFDASGNLYATNLIDDELLEINTSDGTTTLLGAEAPEFPRIASLAFDQSTGTLFGVEADIGAPQLVRFVTALPPKPAVYMPVLVGPISGTDIVSLAVAPSAITVPEPSSLALLATGAFGLFGYGWRRREKQAA